MQIMFQNPVYLWYLLSIPLLIITHFLSLKSAKSKAMKFANFKTLQRISGRHYLTKNTWVLVLRIIVLVLLIISASGMEYWYLTERDENNYILAIDVSSSMSAQDFPPTRLAAAKTHAAEFVEKLDPNAEIGVITFSGVTLIEQTLTRDRDSIQAALERVDTVKAGGTDIPGAVITATNLLLANREKGKVIILITDGSSTLGNFIDRSMEQSITYAQENFVVINALGIGSESSPIGYLPEYYNISATYNENLLLKVTNSTGGIFAEAENVDEISTALDILVDMKEEAYKKVPLGLGALILGILLLFVEWGLINSRYRRIT